MSRNYMEAMILLAEDNEVNRELFDMQLSALGYTVKTAVDGKQALQFWNQNSFAMVLTDCRMPEMNGYELARAIRETEKGKNEHVPIVALTANAVEEELELCVQSGMDDCLTKPVEMGVLQQLLVKWMPVVAKSGHG